MKSVLFFGSLSLAFLLQNSCCTPHLNTSGKLSEVGKSYTGFANEVPEKVYLKNGVYYAEVKQQAFTYSAPVIDHAFCPDAGESRYESMPTNEMETQIFYFPLVAPRSSLPLSKDAYILQLQANKNTLIAASTFDKTGAESVPVKSVVVSKRNIIAKAAGNNNPIITDTTTSTTNHLMKPLVALDSVAIDLPLTVAGGVPLAVGGGLYKGGQWIGSLFAASSSSMEETTIPTNEEESPAEEVTPAVLPVAAPAATDGAIQQEAISPVQS